MHATTTWPQHQSIHCQYTIDTSHHRPEACDLPADAQAGRWRIAQESIKVVYCRSAFNFLAGHIEPTKTLLQAFIQTGLLVLAVRVFCGHQPLIHVTAECFAEAIIKAPSRRVILA